jgi:hypothetical protein
MLRIGFTWNAGAQNPTSIGQPNLLVAAGEPNVPSDPSFASGLNTVTVTGFTQFGRNTNNCRPWSIRLSTIPRSTTPGSKGITASSSAMNTFMNLRW